MLSLTLNVKIVDFHCKNFNCFNKPLKLKISKLNRQVWNPLRSASLYCSLAQDGKLSEHMVSNIFSILGTLVFIFSFCVSVSSL